MTVSQKQISKLEAEITALTMLVETLWVTRLAEADDPKAAAAKITTKQFKTDEKVRDRVGESEFSLRVSDAVTSLIDRAVLRSLRLKARRKQ